jgi:hypothetical protein
MHGGELSGIEWIADAPAAVIDATWPVSSAPSPAPAAGDIDGDGAIDLLFGRDNGQSHGDVSIFLGIPDARQLTVADLQWGDVVISELMANPDDCSDGSGEWVELHNRTAQAVQLEDLELFDLSGNQHALDALVLPAGGYALLGRGSGGWCMPVSPDLGFVGPSLNNGGDVLELVAGGVSIDQVDYGRATAGVALQRDGELWCDAVDPLGASELGTPGQANPPCDDGSEVRSVASLGDGDLVVTEIMANPAAVSDSAGEWIEVYNPGDSTVDLQGLVIRDEGGHTGTIDTSVVLGAGGFAVLAIGDEDSWLGGFTPDAHFGRRPALNNSGDLVQLETGAGIVIDTTARYVSARSGVALQLSDDLLRAGANDLADSWCDATEASTGSTDLGTPGAANTVCP